MNYLNIIIPKDFKIIEVYMYEFNEIFDYPLELKKIDTLKNGDISYIYNVQEDQEDLVKVLERQFILWKMDLQLKCIETLEEFKEILYDGIENID